MFEHMENDIFNAIRPIVSSYAGRFHRLCHSSGMTSYQLKGFSTIRVQDVPSKVIDESKMKILDSDEGNSGLANVSSTAKDEQPKDVKSDPTSERDMFQPTNVDVDQGSNDNVSSEKDSILSSAPVERKNDPISVLQVPSYSQDSNNTSATAISHQAGLNGIECTDEGSDMKNGEFGVEPRVNLLPKAPDVVFPSQQCRIRSNLQIKDDESSPRRYHNEPKDSVQTIAMLKKETGLSGDIAVTEESDHPQPEAKQGACAATATNEFCFWGSGFDSDFEINPLPEMCVPPKLDPDSVLSSKRKRPTSLNEAAYAACMSRRKKAQQSSSRNDPQQPGRKVDQQNSTENSIQGSEKHEEIVNSDMLKERRKIDAKDGHAELHTSSAPLDVSTSTSDDQDILYLIALEESLKDTPSMQNRFCQNFSSTLVEKEVFKDIIDRIPLQGPSPRVVQIKNNWFDHKTFGLSMRVFGKVSKYAIDVMGQTLMSEQYEKAELDLLPDGFWYRHIVEYERARLLQDNVQSISKLFTEPNQGYMLDRMHLIFLPLFCTQTWYLVVANFRDGRFEVICPCSVPQRNEIESDSTTVIQNFKRIFKLAYSRSVKVNVFEMSTAPLFASSSKNLCDSGIFVMKLMKSHDGGKQHFFKGEDAKPLRESLSYYLLTHPCNKKYCNLVETKKILAIHGETVEFYH